MQEELDLGSQKIKFKIGTWNDLKDLSKDVHDEGYLNILIKHDYSYLPIPIPLKGRYTKGRRWTNEEFEACFSAWEAGVSLTLIAANLNRNPQDMIYKLLDRCKQKGLKFTQKGRTESTKKWDEKVKSCAEELFEHGLPAWKISVIFQVEFEHVEKELFANRKGYGHNKKNPFTINTDHKQYVNETVIQGIDESNLSVLEAFAGEGRFTKILLDSDSVDKIICVEENEDTFNELTKNIIDHKATLVNKDNLDFFHLTDQKFDIIDLDPFITCNEQLEIVWSFLNDESYLFVTFGGEYRRSFIKTNRKSICNRYGFIDMESENKDYFEIIPYYFLGFVANKAHIHGFTFEVIRAVRYANNCRYWLKVTRSTNAEKWFSNSVQLNDKGILFKQLDIPRFKEVRKEIDEAKKVGFSR